MLQPGDLRRTLLAAVHRYSGNFAVYFVVGGACALVEWTAFAVAIQFIHYVTAAVIGFVVGTMANYGLSRRVAFVRRESSTYQEIVRTYVVSGFAIAVNMATMILLVEAGGMLPLPAKIIGTGCGFLFNFCGRQFWVFAPVARYPALWRRPQ